LVGLRRCGKSVKVHPFNCPSRADGVGADWMDHSGGNEFDGVAVGLCGVLNNKPVTLA